MAAVSSAGSVASSGSSAAWAGRENVTVIAVTMARAYTTGAGAAATITAPVASIATPCRRYARRSATIRGRRSAYTEAAGAAMTVGASCRNEMSPVAAAPPCR